MIATDYVNMCLCVVVVVVVACNPQICFNLLFFASKMRKHKNNNRAYVRRSCSCGLLFIISRLFAHDVMTIICDAINRNTDRLENIFPFNLFLTLTRRSTKFISIDDD